MKTLKCAVIICLILCFSSYATYGGVNITSPSEQCCCCDTACDCGCPLPDINNEDQGVYLQAVPCGDGKVLNLSSLSTKLALPDSVCKDTGLRQQETVFISACKFLSIEQEPILQPPKITAA